jgi:outer membrane receptor protein involved in Fe transport
VETQNLRSLSDVAQQTPNVYFTDFTGSAPTITVRGLGFSDDESDSTSTSVLIDGVPVYGLALSTLFDLEQIEVLRGPQSTLYGQSSMGGILALRTRDLGFSFGGTAQVDYGTGHRRRLGVATDLPLSSDTALRLAIGSEDADGYVKNTALGRDDTGRWRSRFARLKFLHLDPSGGEWRLGLHHVEREGGNDFFAPAALARRHESNASDAGTNDTDYTLLTGAYARRFSNGTKLNVTLGGSTAHWDYWLPRSLYGGPSGFHTRTRQYSAEARLSSEPAPAGGFDWLVGTYASSLKKEAPYLFEIPGYMRSSTEADIEGRTAAVFGELGWRFAPSWRLAGALRYEHDRRRMNWRSDQRGYYDGNGDGLPDTPYGFSAAIQGLKVRDNMLMPRLTLEFQPDAQQFAWATLARGYKASGFNLYATEPASAGTPYAPEYGNYAELGYRTRAADNSWEFGGTAFYTRLRDQQVVVIGRSGQSLVSNAGRSHNVGVELTGTVRPSHTLEFTGFAGYVKAVYDEYVNGGVDYAGEQFPNTPRHSVGVAVNWKPAPAWNAGLSVRRTGASHLYPNSRVRNDAYTLVDAHLDYRFQRWTLGLYGKNLGNATYFTRALGDRMLVAAQPRTVGLRASIDF